MAELKLGITGADGRMGRALVHAIDQAANCVLVAALEHEQSSAIGKDCGILAGTGENAVLVTCDPAKAIRECDCIIDFTTPEASCTLAELAAGQNCSLVIGTTGCSVEQDSKIAERAKTATIIKSGNMSLGINLLAVLVERAAQALAEGDFDIEVLEMHHRHKVDAPSGTAMLLGEAAARGRDIDLSKNSIRARDGITGARQTGTIGFATLRGGSVVGDHAVIFAGNGERIEFSHSAQDRSLFAFGALKAALWAKDKPPGLYSLRDVLGF